MKTMRRILIQTAIAAEAGVAVAAAGVLLPTLYHTSAYRVEKVASLPAAHYVPMILTALALAAGAYVFLRTGGAYVAAGRKSSSAALACAWIPLLANVPIVLRACLGISPFYLEPLVLSVSVAAALGLCLGRRQQADRGGAGKTYIPALAAAAAAVAAAVWFYAVQEGFLARLAYGWTDAGLNYLRVKNTARGVGFLQETLARPSFYDHFNCGLALLVPFYRAVGSYSLILWAQAVGLAAVAPAVYVYARGRGSGGWTSFLFALAALVHPSVSQMSCSFSYGFHPVTLALAPVVLSIHFWEKRRWWAFAGAAVLAASFEETLFPLYAGVGIVTFIAGAWQRLRPPGPAQARTSARRDNEGAGAGMCAGLLLAAAAAAGFLVVTKVVMPAFAGKEYFQVAKYAHLGGGFVEILLSPFLKARVFWGLIFSRRSLVFVALVLGGMGFLPLLSPKRFLYPAVILVFVLLLENPDVKSISFWYQALVIAAWLPAAVSGARKFARLPGGGGTRAEFAIAASVALAALGMSHFYGMGPLSRVTVPFQAPRSASFMKDVAALGRYADCVGEDAKVLATMRAAMLFCDAGAVVPLQDWQGDAAYDIVVLDAGDTWGQSRERTKAVYDTVVAAGDFERIPFGRTMVYQRHKP
ncbi:MAG: DUF2079 domain-containing protein [Planctomycetes bacterium]|nr:DUF2079 domain-containing protein [Planctomycetota bacterium]